jgi:Zn-finger nucleic acid-binding protein
LIPLTTGQYEGVSLRCCTQCGGVLADRAVISRLTSRKEGAFPLEVVDAAKKVIADAQKVRAPGVTRFAHDLSCPLCGERMLTSFYSHDYRIEIDSCGECKVTWFDKNELQIVEYIAEFSDQVMEEIL